MLANERLRRWLKFLVALGVSVVFSFLFIRSVDLDKVGDALAGADYVYVVPALALFAASVAFRAQRWACFLEPQRRLTWLQLLPSLLVGYAGNNLLPLRAGELLRAQHLAEREGVARMHTFGTLMMERLFDGLVLATFVLWGLLLTDASTAYLGAGLALAAAAVGGFVVCTLLANRPGVVDGIAALPLPFLSSGVREVAAALGGSFLAGFSVLRDARRFTVASVASVAAWGLELAMYWLISQAFDLHASFITIAFAGAAANVAMSLPTAQGGIGPFHHFATQALVRSSIAAEPAAAYAVALHLFLIVPVSLVGLAVLWRTTLSSARRAAPLPASVIETTPE
jgi:uncharacterized protein (TIRG00374 family)